jgi:signal transduction histidine kinase/CheY-like chemotaxis protein/HPt (histidine-containing phosphotransfer) domain-containing protein
VPRPARSSAPRLALLQEQRYRQRFLDVDRKQTALVTIVVAIAIITTTRNDVLLLSGTSWLRPTLALKALYVVATLTSLALLRRARSPWQHDRAAAIGLAATTISLIFGDVTRLPSGEAQGPAFGNLAIICALYFAHRSPSWHRALACLPTALMALVLVSSPGAVISDVGRLSATLAIVGLNVIGLVSARTFEDNRRQRFEAERHERHLRQELSIKLRELAAEKERAESLSRARAAFLAAMSHEFRTPMNAVIGLSDLLLDAPLAPDHRAHVRTISDSARALLGLLEDILDFAKIDAQKLTLSPAPFDLPALAASVAAMLRPAAAARSVELAVELAPDVPAHLRGDDARLRQVLVNLVSNAVKFTERGSVTLRVAARPLGEGDHEIAFRVEDTGIGMAPEVLSRIFRPFEQADAGSTRRHGGTGLGLAISKQIVAAMGGDIQVESEPGRGSVFSFTLRLAAAAPPERASAEPPAAPRVERPPLAILVVDDHVINREVARTKLARLGYAVDLAPGGAEALEAVARREYDVVFMDLHMPGMSGVEVTARLGEALAGRRAPRVVAMTASVFDEDREACRRAGMVEFIGKPIDLAQLDAVLGRVAEERGAAAPPAPPAATLSGGALAGIRHIEGLGESGFFESLCRIFLAETRERLPRMREALARGDAPEVAREAHPLRSASASLGALEMSEICGRVEGAARAGRIDDLGAGIDALAAQLVEVERALAQEQRGGAA